jgi:hypothetical protein
VNLPPVRIACGAEARYKKGAGSSNSLLESAMRASKRWFTGRQSALLACLLLLFFALDRSLAAQPGYSILPVLQERFGLSEEQVRDALGALLVFTRERLPEPAFNELAATVPNADLAMQQVKMRGIVTSPLDDLDDYEAALGNTGISPAQAAQFAPAVLEALHATGHDRERDILAGALD